MSRFLISTMPAAGHVHPALPIAAALAERGHEVRWHTGARYGREVEAAGATFVKFRHTLDFDALPAEPDPSLRGPAAGVDALRKLLVDRMAGQLADYEAILDGWPADAVLVDLCALGARALGERRGTPWATLGISPLSAQAPDVPPFGTMWSPPTGPLGRARVRAYNRLGDVVMRGLAAAYAERRRALGLPPLGRGERIFDHMLSPHLHLQAATPLIEYPRRPWPASIHLVGPLLPKLDGQSRPPEWWGELSTARAVVHITQGTVATDPATLTRPAIDALADLDALVVVTTPDPAALGPVPKNTRVTTFVPHAALLPRVDAMLSNGGYNGAKAALAHGVPLVIAPWGNDQPDVAARIAWAGAGINLRTRTPKPAAIAAAVREVLAEPRYRAAARRVRDEFAAHPGGERAADLLEQFVDASVSRGK